MINLDTSLEPRFYPLAWLLGSWEGWGMAGEGNYVIQQASFETEGSQLVQRVKCWKASPKGEAPSMMADAPEGLKFLAAGDLAWEETTRWTVVDSVPATADTQASSRCTAESEGGVFGGYSRWELNTLGPRVMAAGKPESSDAPDAPVAFSRLFGLVGGELFWSQDGTFVVSADGAAGEGEGAAGEGAADKQSDAEIAAQVASEDAGTIDESVAYNDSLEERNLFSARLARVGD